jgi:arabinose-5-phosphate isomerase
MTNEEILNLARETIARESAAVAQLAGQLDESFANVANALLDCRGHVLVAGSGTSNPVAARFAHLLSCVGTPALFIHPGDSQHGLAGAVTARDVLICISKGGETTEVIHLARVAKARDATLVALTEKPASTLAQMADFVLTVVAPREVDPFGMVATGSSLVNSAFADAICVALLSLRGYGIAEFGQTHPGGAVGRKLRGEDQ